MRRVMSVPDPVCLVEHLFIVTQALFIALVRFYVNGSCHEPEAPFGSLLMTSVSHAICTTFIDLGSH